MSSDVSNTESEAISKDNLVLAMLAVMGGERREVNERDLFLACWHAFPNAMRWTDTALPNPDTFTASLRRLDADGVIQRIGKQSRSRRKPSRRQVLEVARSGVVKARIKEGGLETAGVTPDVVERVRRLAPPPESYRAIDPALLIALFLHLRTGEKRLTDEGALVETVFHKFPAVFAYRERPEFPDTESIRSAIRDSQQRGLVNGRLELTEAGQSEVAKYESLIDLRLDPSATYRTGAFKLAERIEAMPGYKTYKNTGSLTATKGDELFRALRIAPTADPRPVATSLVARSKELRRIDKGELAEYLLKVAGLHNPDVVELLESERTAAEQTAARS